MITKERNNIFKNGSKTYFYTSLFFEEQIKIAVFTLYAFVRTVDDFVDATPQQNSAFLEFYDVYTNQKLGIESNNQLIKDFIQLEKQYNFDPSWVEAFFYSMKLDLTKTTYATLAETEKYIFGSAEVIGMMMARILNLPKNAYESAAYLGKAMQYVNFIRDIAEDIQLGRNYFPQEDMREFSLTNLHEEETKKNPENFKNFIYFEYLRYSEWQRIATAGFTFIPKRNRIPVQTASDLYAYTVAKIVKNPFIVYRKKVKPSIAHIILQMSYHLMH